MDRTPETNDTEALAAVWLVRLELDASPENLAQWRLWLREDNRHHAVYLRLANAWGYTDCLKKLRPLDGSIDLSVLDTFPGLQSGAQATSSRRRRGVYWATAVAAAVALVWSAWLGHTRPERMTYRTEAGGLQRILLPDGSAALLNTNSEIRLRYTRQRREIDLVRGEGLFSVTHSEGRPFEVRARGSTVRALATSFDVRLQAENDSLEVMVDRGRVAVGPATGNYSALKVQLASGDDLVLDGKGAAHLSRVAGIDIDHRLAWVRGQIWLQEDTLAQAIAEFNRYNSRKLTLADPALAALRVGGSFSATDPTAFIAALERVFGIRALSATDDFGAPVIRLVGPATARP